MTVLKTALMISRYFPPMFDVGGKRVYRLARYLPEFGWRAVVLTGKSPPESLRDETPLDLPSSTRVERVFEPWWWKVPRLRPSDGTIRAPVRPSGLLQRLSKLVDVPVGPERLLVGHLAREAGRLAEEEGARIVFATSSPYAVLVAGDRAARRAGLPCCLDLRDPWSLNFLQQNKPGWTRSLERAVESRLFHRASKITFTCESATTAYREAYPDLPSSRMATLRNAFDPQDRPPKPAAAADTPITLLHFGNCYGPRRLETVLRAMARLAKERPDGPRIVLRNLGRVGEPDLRLAKELGIERDFEFEAFVPFADGLRQLAAADLAVLVAYGRETLFIPAKLYDYLLARAPTLCISQPGELADIVESTRAGAAIRPGDVSGAAEIIRRAVDARTQGRPAFVADEERLEAFSAREAARNLAGIFDELVAGSAASGA